MGGKVTRRGDRCWMEYHETLKVCLVDAFVYSFMSDELNVFVLSANAVFCIFSVNFVDGYL